jgi:hypothetical protein
LNLIIAAMLNVCLFLGLLQLWKQRFARQDARFLLFAFAGVLLSAPFAPPIDADSMRAYSATFPIVVAITAVGIARLCGVKAHNDSNPDGAVQMMLIPLSAVVILLAVLGPWFVRGSAHEAFSETGNACPVGETSYVFQTHPAMAVHLVEGSGGTLRDVYPSTRLNVASFRDNLTFTGGVFDEWKRLSSGSTIFIGREITEPRVSLFVARTTEIVPYKGVWGGCGQPGPGITRLLSVHALRPLSAP